MTAGGITYYFGTPGAFYGAAASTTIMVSGTVIMVVGVGVATVGVYILYKESC